MSKISMSSLLKSFVASNIAIIKSASCAIFLDFFTPICSTSLVVFLIPAVSIKFNGIPFIFTNSSIVSLVVPSILVTIALSSSNMAFKSDDFPAFGLPKITVLIPSEIILPLSEVLNNLSKVEIIFSTSIFNSSP